MAARILIVDDSEVFRAGLRTLIEAGDGWEICGEANDGPDAIEKCRQLRPDLIIMDLSMPGMSGIQAAREILRECATVPILLLTFHLTAPVAEQARSIGIRGTLSKTATQHLDNAISALLRGGEFSAPS